MFSYFLLTAYRVAKLNKNSFYVSRSRLGGDTENKFMRRGTYYAVKPKSVGNYTCICTRQPSEVSLSYVRKCVSYRTCDVSTNGK